MTFKKKWTKIKTKKKFYQGGCGPRGALCSSQPTSVGANVAGVLPHIQVKVKDTSKYKDKDKDKDKGKKWVPTLLYLRVLPHLEVCCIMKQDKDKGRDKDKNKDKDKNEAYFARILYSSSIAYSYTHSATIKYQRDIEKGHQ